jgi:hypothetical protein
MSTDKKFTIVIRDYEPGTVEDIDADAIESVVSSLLNARGDDGIVIVSEN